MLFSKPSAIDRFNLSMRCKTIPSIEHILALVFNDSYYEDWKAYDLGAEVERNLQLWKDHPGHILEPLTAHQQKEHSQDDIE